MGNSSHKEGQSELNAINFIGKVFIGLFFVVIGIIWYLL